MFGKKEKTILAMMDYSITPESQLKDLGDFEFPGVVLQRTQAELGCSNDELEAVVISLLNYFAVVKDETNVEMVDTKADVLWHTLLLDTRAYMDLCANYIGFYVHHHPYITKRTMSSPTKEKLVKNYERSRARHPRLNQRYSHYVDHHRDDDTLSDLLFFCLIASEMSNCNSGYTSSTDAVTESNCASSGADEISYDTTERFNDAPVRNEPVQNVEPEISRSNCRSGSSTEESSCSSNCSSSSSSSCSSSSSSSCGSSCGSD